MDIKSKIRTIPDFPQKGIMFKDITPLLQDPGALNYVTLQFADYCKDKKVDAVAGIESRGFIFGALLAVKMNVSFIPIRKKGKLPYKKVKQTYQKEYGPDTIEAHADALKKGDNILIVDDLLATGGTCKATVDLIEKLGGSVVGIAFLIELGFLKGREKLKGYDIFHLINY